MRSLRTLLSRSLIVFPSAVVVLLVAAQAQAQLGASVANWTVSSHGTSSRSTGGLTTMGDVTSPTPFIGVSPCRIVDTRGPTGTFGAPSLSPGSPRSFPLPSGPCAGIPAGVAAYSLNVTATNTLGPGFFKIFPQGGASPTVSTLNYVAGQTIANAAVVPAGTGGGITVAAGVSGADLIIDINGYYAATPGTATNSFSVINSGISAIYGETNNTDGAAAGVHGKLTAGPGQGVFGETTSPADGTAGVLGVASASTGSNEGIVGFSRSTSDGST
ncbi:MAG TPA: hypothetical protein VKJ00_05680, partial [Thermoanaerobaculia bacterium]|nr:hypothetical protein [Thermoanaerobaculia bacterium]